MLPVGVLLLAEDVKPLRRLTDRILAWIEDRRPHWLGLRPPAGARPWSCLPAPIPGRASPRWRCWRSSSASTIWCLSPCSRAGFPSHSGRGRARWASPWRSAPALALLWSIVWIIHLTEPVFSLAGHAFSWRDVILIAGGGFLLFKGTREIHLRVDGLEDDASARPGATGFIRTVLEIMLLDVVFSLDSVITAVGIADEIWVMVAAIVAAMIVMLAASGPLAAFIERHASVKMLALSFLLLIGMVLVADGFSFHVPRGYVYAAMGFSILVESLNLIAARRRSTRSRRIQSRKTTGVSEVGKQP